MYERNIFSLKSFPSSGKNKLHRYHIQHITAGCVCASELNCINLYYSELLLLYSLPVCMFYIDIRFPAEYTDRRQEMYSCNVCFFTL